MRIAIGLTLLAFGCSTTEIPLRARPKLGLVDSQGSLVGEPDTTSETSSSEETSSSTAEETSSGTSTSASTSTSTSTTITTTGDPPIGVDVSHWNGSVDWDDAASDGVAFAIVKASEGSYYVTDSDSWENQYWGAYDAGLIRGAYHFAIPDDSSGAEQADYFVDNGGGWTADGQTLPGTLDIEWNPYWSDACYGLSQSEMIDWIGDFLDQYYVRTGREAIIYTASSWWAQCVGGPDFAAWPLWVAHWGVASPTLPSGWSAYTFWQTSATGSISGISGDVDTDIYGGSPDQLYHFALSP